MSTTWDVTTLQLLSSGQVLQIDVDSAEARDNGAGAPNETI